MTEQQISYTALPDWLVPQEAARVMRISQTRLYQLLRSGAMPSRRVGRQWRIPRVAVDPTMAALPAGIQI